MVRGKPLSRFPIIGRLKRYVVGCFSLGGVGSIADEAQLPRYDFSPIALTRSLFGFVLAGSKLDFDVELPPFGQESLARVRQLVRTQRSDANPCGFALRRFDP